MYEHSSMHSCSTADENIHRKNLLDVLFLKLQISKILFVTTRAYSENNEG
jgi:hypothetical protein